LIHVEYIDEAPLWALVAFTLLASTVIHDLTARETVRLLDRSAESDGTKGDRVAPR
jgi:hypothetical protein